MKIATQPDACRQADCSRWPPWPATRVLGCSLPIAGRRARGNARL